MTLMHSTYNATEVYTYIVTLYENTPPFPVAATTLSLVFTHSQYTHLLITIN